MSEEKLLKLAESGEWKDRTIGLLRRKTNAHLDVIQSFVSEHWQNLASDEENLYNFEIYESDYQKVYAY